MSDLWEARRAAARSVLVGYMAEHEREARHAKAGVVYMDACKPRDDAHPAVAIVEKAHFDARVQDALFHTRQAEAYRQAIKAIDELEPETEEK